MGADRQAGAGRGARLSDRGPEGGPVRDLRHRQQRGVRVGRAVRRNRAVHGREHPRVVGAPRKARFPHATRLTITADCGGGNSPRVHLWKVELQRLADETGLELALCHFPPGTSKWNKIEHRLFSFISLNWRGRPLTSYQVIIDL